MLLVSDKMLTKNLVSSTCTLLSQNPTSNHAVMIDSNDLLVNILLELAFSNDFTGMFAEGLTNDKLITKK